MSYNPPKRVENAKISGKSRILAT